MTSGVNILATIQAKGCRSADAFADGNPYIKYLSLGKYDGGLWQVIYKNEIVKTFDVMSDKEDKEVQFTKAKFWVEVTYYLENSWHIGSINFSKTPFNTWMETNLVKNRIVEILNV